MANLPDDVSRRLDLMVALDRELTPVERVDLKMELAAALRRQRWSRRRTRGLLPARGARP